MTNDTRTDRDQKDEKGTTRTAPVEPDLKNRADRDQDSERDSDDGPSDKM